MGVSVPPGLVPAWISDIPTYILVPALLVGVPALAIALNVLRQVALPRDKSLPPVVFHYIPWFGSAAYYGEDPYRFFFECREKYGDLFTFVLFGRRITVALGPKGNNLSLGGKVNQVSAEEAYTHLTTPVFGKGVVYDCPNDMLMQQKKFIKFGLTTEALESYASLFEEEARRFFEQDLKLSASGLKTKSVDPLQTMATLITYTASRTLQGAEVRESLNHRMAELLHDLDSGFTPLNFLFPNLPLKSYRTRDNAQREMSDFYLDIMRKRREGKSNMTEHDMLAALQGSVYKNGVALTDRDIAHMMIAILMAGQHTSSSTTTWILLHLASRPDIAEMLYDEQKTVCGQADGTFHIPTLDDTKNMKLMDSVIRETLRIHPPIHSIYRKVISPITVPTSLAAPSETSSYVIPKGYFVLAAPGVSAVDPLIWAEPNNWDPLRWQDEKGVAATAQQTYEGDAGEKIDYGFGQVSKGTESPYQPFGAGRHRCVGEHFAYLQLSCILSYIVQNYTLKLDTKEFPKPDYHSMMVLPLKPKMSFTRRKQDV